MFLYVTVCHSVQGGWYPSMHCRWYPRLPCRSPRGGGIPACLTGLQAHTQGGCLQAPTQGVGGIPACTEADTPPADGFCCGAVCILLECILILTQHSEINVRFIDCKVLSLIYPAMNSSSLLSQLCLIKVNHLFTLSYPHLFQI